MSSFRDSEGGQGESMGNCNLQARLNSHLSEESRLTLQGPLIPRVEPRLPSLVLGIPWEVCHYDGCLGVHIKTCTLSSRGCRVGVWTEGTSQKAGQPSASGTHPEAALTQTVSLAAPEPLNDDGSNQGFVNSFLVFFSCTNVYVMFQFLCLNKNKTFSDNSGSDVCRTWEDGGGSQGSGLRCSSSG